MHKLVFYFHFEGWYDPAYEKSYRRYFMNIPYSVDFFDISVEGEKTDGMVKYNCVLTVSSVENVALCIADVNQKGGALPNFDVSFADIQ